MEFHRPKSGSKKFKQLKKARRNADVEQEKIDFFDEDDIWKVAEEVSGRKKN